MWHEARKQEKKIREAMIDFQKRAERRREHYDKMRVDPSTFLRVIGIACPLHLDPTGGAKDSSMIPWQGDEDNLISRYDVRMHMDYIPDETSVQNELSPDEQELETKCNYERYRTLVQTSFTGASEADSLAKIELSDMFPTPNKKKNKDKNKSQSKAAIGFNYDDNDGVGSRGPQLKEYKESSSSDSENDISFDVERLSKKQIDKLNVIASDHGIARGFYSKTLRVEKTIQLERKEAKMVEAEKSAFSGKKARRERRLFKDMMLKSRGSPPSYCETFHFQKNYSYGDDKDDDSDDGSDTSSRSSTSEKNEGKLQFITEFGLEEPQPTTTAHKSTDGYKPGSRRGRRRDSSPSYYENSSRRRSRSRSRDRHRYRSRSRSRERRRSYSRERYSRYYHSRSRSPPSRSRRSYSRSRSRSTERVTAKLAVKKAKDTKDGTKKAAKAKLTPKERLQKKMQAQLSKTFKEEKKVERNKAEAREAERMVKEDNLREMNKRLRARHGYAYDDSESD